MNHNNPSQDARWHSVMLNGVKETQLHSTLTTRDYLIQTASIGETPAAGYPVIYFLDGNALLPLAVLLAQILAFKPYCRQQVLLVGIGYPTATLYDTNARAMDYLPHQTQSENDGAGNLHKFISNSVKPLIASQYRINDSQQALMGHSFGGLFTLYTLFNHTEAFSTYLISSPSIWWNKQKILNDEDNLHITPHRIMLSCGEFEQFDNPKVPSNAERLAKITKRQMVDNTSMLNSRLTKRFPSADIGLSIYKSEDHASVVPRAIMAGLTTFLLGN